MADVLERVAEAPVFVARHGEGNAWHQHPVKPALEHGRLAEPPGGIDEDQRVAPLQAFHMAGDAVGVAAGVFVVGPVFQRHGRLETLGIEVDHAGFGAGLGQFLQHGLRTAWLKLAAGMAIDDQRFHAAACRLHGAWPACHWVRTSPSAGDAVHEGTPPFSDRSRGSYRKARDIA
jgi:hypothetical protein